MASEARLPLHAKSENPLEAGPVHPAGRAGVPRPAAAPDVRRYRIDVCGDDVGLHLVAVYVCARGGAVDRIEEREQLRRLVPLPEDCVRDHRPGGGVSVLPAVFPDTGRIALDVARIERRAVEGWRKQQGETGIAPDELALYGGHGTPGTGRLGRPGDHAPGLWDGVDAALRAARRSERRSVVIVASPVPVAVPRLLLERCSQRCRVGQPPCRALILLTCSCQRRESHECCLQEPSEPDAFAPAPLAHAVHAVVPVAGADQRQTVFSDLQALVERSRAVLEEGGGVIRDYRLEIGVLLVRQQRAAFEKGNLLVQEREIAGRLDVAGRGVRQPAPIGGNACTNSGAARALPGLR